MGVGVGCVWGGLRGVIGVGVAIALLLQDSLASAFVYIVWVEALFCVHMFQFCVHLVALQQGYFCTVCSV